MWLHSNGQTAQRHNVLRIQGHTSSEERCLHQHGLLKIELTPMAEVLVWQRINVTERDEAHIRIESLLRDPCQIWHGVLVVGGTALTVRHKPRLDRAGILEIHP